jgi:hypothetical protein
MDDKQSKLKEVGNSINDATFDALEDQGQRAAGNMLLMYDESATTPGGFIGCVMKAHNAALMWLVAEGYVTLTEKALATDEEKAERAKKREASTLKPSARNGTAGQYL